MLLKAINLLACLAIVSSKVITPRALSKGNAETSFGDAPRGTKGAESLANIQLDNGQVLALTISPMNDGGKQVQTKYVFSVSGEYVATKAPTAATIGKIIEKMMGKGFFFPVEAIGPLMTAIKAGQGSVIVYRETDKKGPTKAVSNTLDNRPKNIVEPVHKGDTAWLQDLKKKDPIVLVPIEGVKNVQDDFLPQDKGAVLDQGPNDQIDKTPNGDIIVLDTPVHQNGGLIRMQPQKASIDLIKNDQIDKTPNGDIIVLDTPVHQNGGLIRMQPQKASIELIKKDQIPENDLNQDVVDIQPVHKGGHQWRQPKEEFTVELKPVEQQNQGGANLLKNPEFGKALINKLAPGQVNLEVVSKEQAAQKKSQSATRQNLPEQNSILNKLY